MCVRRDGVEGGGFSAVAGTLAGARGCVAVLCASGETESEDVHVAERQAVGGKADSEAGGGVRG